MRYIDIIFRQGFQYNRKISNFLFENLEILKLNEILLNIIKSSFDSKQDFEIDKNYLRNLKFAIEERLLTLISDKEFDKFKIELRKINSEKYESFPIILRGKTYYAYSKDKINSIDSKVIEAYSFLKVVDEHIKNSINLKFFYLEPQ